MVNLWHWVQENFLNHEKILGGIAFFLALIFKEWLQEVLHSGKIALGLKSNLTQALGRDKKIDAVLDELVNDNKDVLSAVVEKITNGGGIPKEGAPINISIVNPVRVRPDWPPSEASPFVRNAVQIVYEKKNLPITLESFPTDEPSYAYLRSQKTEITYVWIWLLKEKRKCRYILSLRMTGTIENGNQNMVMRENIRKGMNSLKKYLN